MAHELSAQLAELPAWLLWTCAFVFGAAVGSFLNVVIARLPEGKSVVRPASACPHCDYSIPWYLNVPLLSWIVLRGRCAHCKAPISVRYPTVELLTALLFTATAVRFGPSPATPFYLVLVTALVPITFIDIDIWEIPDELVFPALFIGAVFRSAVFSVPWWEGISAAALGAGIIWIIRGVGSWLMKREAMGLGDAPLLAAIGAYLGPASVFPVLMVASISGALIGGLSLLLKRADAAPIGSETQPGETKDWVPALTAIPFGPYLSIGGVAYLLFAPALLRLFFPWLSG